MRLSQVLDNKGASVVTARPDTSLTEAVRLLVEANIGAVVVMGDEGPVGIFSERDLLRYVAAGEPDFDRAQVAEFMTKELITATPTQGVSDAMELMKVHRIRHLPIVQDGEMVGIVSVRDVIDAIRRATEDENQHLKTYIFSGY
jgi:CBS domain-containing protein